MFKNVYSHSILIISTAKTPLMVYKHTQVGSMNNFVEPQLLTIVYKKLIFVHRSSSNSKQNMKKQFLADIFQGDASCFDYRNSEKPCCLHVLFFFLLFILTKNDTKINLRKDSSNILYEKPLDWVGTTLLFIPKCFTCAKENCSNFVFCPYLIEERF